MTDVLVLSPEPVRARMAGMGIRALRIAQTLAADGHAVTLAGPPGSEAQAAGGIALLDVRSRAFLAAQPAFAVAIASGHAGDWLGRDVPHVVGDLYDPFFVENLAYHGSLGPEVFARDTRSLFRLLARADLLLAASEEQRLFYLGLLLGRGLVAPAELASDPDARQLVDTAPFGVDEADPGPPRPDPSIGPGPHDVFFGGVYDWYDPGLVLDAWESVLARVPDARLLFAESPNPASTPQRELERAVERSRERGWFGRSVHVLRWTPLPLRGGLYRSARCAVLAHRASLESRLSFRTRVLDYLWAGLPVVATDGGAAADLLARRGAGLAVPPEGLADALVSVLRDDALHAHLADGARAAAGLFTWSATLEPLRRFVAAPRTRAKPSLGRRVRHAVLGRA